jgi:hypothetical protein
MFSIMKLTTKVVLHSLSHYKEHQYEIHVDRRERAKDIEEPYKMDGVKRYV